MKNLILKLANKAVATFLATTCFSINAQSIPADVDQTLRFQTSASHRLIENLIKDKLFNGDILLSRLNNKVLNVQGKNLPLLVQKVGDGQININLEGDLNLLVASEEQGNWLYGGKGEVYLTEFKLSSELKSLNMTTRSTTIKVDEAASPAVVIRSTDNNFRLVQRGYVKIKKHVLWYSWTDYKRFAGVFTDITWVGAMQLKTVPLVLNGNTYKMINLNHISSSVAIGHREFVGEGIPAAKFLQDYGDKFEAKLASMLGASVDDVSGFNSGESSSTGSTVSVERKLAGLFATHQPTGTDEEKLQTHLQIRHEVHLSPTELFMAHPCAAELLPPVTEVGFPTSAIADHNVPSATLRNSVPLSLYERSIYLKGRRGELCLPALSDGNGGTIQFIPIGTIRLVPVNLNGLALGLHYRFEHRHPLLPNVVQGTVHVSRAGAIRFANDETGRTTSLYYQGIGDTVSTTADVRYAEALKSIFAERPMMLPVPLPQKWGPYVGRIRSATNLGRTVIFDYSMHAPVIADSSEEGT